MSVMHYDQPWVYYNGCHTLEYWHWRLREQLGLPWPEQYDGESWYQSRARSYTRFRNSERDPVVRSVRGRYPEPSAADPDTTIVLGPRSLCWGRPPRVANWPHRGEVWLRPDVMEKEIPKRN